METVAGHCLERRDERGAFSHPAFTPRKFWFFLLVSGAKLQKFLMHTLDAALHCTAQSRGS